MRFFRIKDYLLTTAKIKTITKDITEKTKDKISKSIILLALNKLSVHQYSLNMIASTVTDYSITTNAMEMIA